MKGYATIERILNEEFDVGVLSASSITILWAADKIANVETARRELRAINRRRHQMGKTLAYADYGHRLFGGRR
jgi:hypothetical protein